MNIKTLVITSFVSVMAMIASNSFADQCPPCTYFWHGVCMQTCIPPQICNLTTNSCSVPKNK